MSTSLFRDAPCAISSLLMGAWSQRGRRIHGEHHRGHVTLAIQLRYLVQARPRPVRLEVLAGRIDQRLGQRGVPAVVDLDVDVRVDGHQRCCVHSGFVGHVTHDNLYP